MVISKTKIRLGTKHVETRRIERLDDEMRLAALNDNEYQRVLGRLKSQGVKDAKIKPVMKNGVVDKEATINSTYIDVDVENAQISNFEASLLAIELSLNNDENSDDEKFTVDELKEFPAGSVDEIAYNVFDISGVEDINLERMETFRSRK